MNAKNSPMLKLWSTMRQRPGMVAIGGYLALLLTPFVFFPEIMGDAGVTDAGPWRNWSALAFLFFGAIAALVGSASFARQVLRKRIERLAKRL